MLTQIFSALSQNNDARYLYYIYNEFVSGTSEAFLHAVATENQLKRSNDSLLVFSVIYIVLNVLLIRSAGAVGLILANSLSILFSLWAFVFVPFPFFFLVVFQILCCLSSTLNNN